MPCSRPAHPINAFLDRRAKLYSLAAAAAGVSALALSQPAQAKVVITNTNIPIPSCLEVTPCSVSIDLNGDGVNDFKASLLSTFDYSVNVRSLKVTPLNGGGVVGTAGHASGRGPYASALLRGAKIGASDHFLAGGKDTIEDSFAVYGSKDFPQSQKLYGKWGGNHPNRFVGVRFKINGKIHYGWIRMTISITSPLPPPFMTATITEYGYETIANKSLGAGLASADAADDAAQAIAEKPRHPSLGMLALGWEGMPLWRREETLTSR